jgi:hypothetical protein
MTTKIIDGIEYIEKTAVDGIVSNRLNKLSEKLKASQELNKNLQGEMDNLNSNTADTSVLSTELADLKSQLENSNLRYNRHTSIAQAGIIDPDLRDAVEWAYERAQKDLPKKDKTGLSVWLSEQMQNPATAPAVLRPHLQTLAAPPQAAAPAAPAQPQAQPVPNINNAVINAPDHSTSADILRRAQTDFEFYRANRELVKTTARRAMGIPTPTKF